MLINTLHKSNYFSRMKGKIKALYPNLTDGQIEYARNKIGNFIRSAHVDLYEITLSNVPIYGVKTAEITSEIAVGEVIIYVWAATD